LTPAGPRCNRHARPLRSLMGADSIATRLVRPSLVRETGTGRVHHRKSGLMAGPAADICTNGSWSAGPDKMGQFWLNGLLELLPRGAHVNAPVAVSPPPSPGLADYVVELLVCLLQVAGAR